jgi:two-component sensor histidine kinase
MEREEWCRSSSARKRSFGTRLIETLGRQLRGDVQLTYAPTGFVYTFDVPMGSLTSAAA